MILITPGRSQTKRRPVPSFGLAMWIGSTKPPATSTSCTLTSPGSLPPGRAHSRSSGRTVDSIWGVSFGLDGGGFTEGADVEHPRATAKPAAHTKFRARFMVLILPISMPQDPTVRGESRRARNLSPPFSSVKPLRPGEARRVDRASYPGEGSAGRGIGNSIGHPDVGPPSVPSGGTPWLRRAREEA